MSILCVRTVQRATGSPYLINPNPTPAHHCDCPPLYEAAYRNFKEGEEKLASKQKPGRGGKPDAGDVDL